MLRVRWTCSSREEDAEGNVLRKHGDTGVFEDERARTHERMRRCEVIEEAAPELEQEPEPTEDLDEDEQEDDEVTDGAD